MGEISIFGRHLKEGEDNYNSTLNNINANYSDSTAEISKNTPRTSEKLLTQIYYFNKLLDVLYPGEFLNKRLFFYYSVGSLFNNFQTILVLGDYSEIMKQFINAILKLLPQEIILRFDGNSRRDLASLDLKGKKILWITDFEKNRKLIKAITETDNNGIIFNKKLKIPKCSIVSFTDNNNFNNNPRLSNSVITLELNNSSKQTKTLSKYRLENTGLKGKILHNEIEKKILLSREFLTNLNTNLNVEITFKKVLNSCYSYIVPYAPIRHVLFEKLIKNITMINQMERIIYPQFENDKKVYGTFIFTEPVDLKYAWRISKNKFSRISEKLPYDQHKFLEFVIKWVQSKEMLYKHNKNQSYAYKIGYYLRKNVIDDYMTYLEKNNLPKYDERTYIKYFQLLSNPKNKYHYINEEKQGLHNTFQLIKAPPLKMFTYNDIKEELMNEHSQYIKAFKKEFNVEF